MFTNFGLCGKIRDMRTLLSLAIIASAVGSGCTYNGATPPPPTYTSWAQPQPFTLVNNTPHRLAIYQDGRLVANALSPGEVHSFTPIDSRASVVAVASDNDGKLLGSAFHHYSFRGEVWMPTSVVRLEP